VGSWHTVWELSAHDADGNATQGSAVFVNSSGSYVSAEKQLVALSGLDNVVVVATDDAILVARREDGEGLRQVVKRVNNVAPTLTQDHLKVWAAVATRCTITAQNIGLSCAGQPG
jgi:mannose-1-phosphate guanylyltransferase/mannose-6-phosphate isomerase